MHMHGYIDCGQIQRPWLGNFSWTSPCINARVATAVPAIHWLAEQEHRMRGWQRTESPARFGKAREPLGFHSFCSQFSDLSAEPLNGSVEVPLAQIGGVYLFKRRLAKVRISALRFPLTSSFSSTDEFSNGYCKYRVGGGRPCISTYQNGYFRTFRFLNIKAENCFMDIFAFDD